MMGNDQISRNIENWTVYTLPIKLTSDLETEENFLSFDVIKIFKK